MNLGGKEVLETRWSAAEQTENPAGDLHLQLH